MTVAPDVVTAETDALLAADAECSARQQLAPEARTKQPLYTVTITHPRDVFALADARQAAERIGKLGRALRVSVVLEPHDGNQPTTFADFGYSAILRAMAFSSATNVPVPPGELMTIGARN